MSNTKSHPLREHLEAYLIGGLSDADFETVCGHLEHCSECVEQAGALEIHDPLIQLLSEASKRTLLEQDASPVIDTVFSSAASHDTDALGMAPLTSDVEIPDALLNHPRYRVIRILGRGGMGTVWLAEHLLLNRLVAIKSIHPEFLSKPGAAERLRREMHAAAKLSHVNVVSALDAETSPGASFLVTEYIEGKTLAELLAEGPFTVAHACRAARDVALGLAHAHSAGLIHRDVKPANLIESTSGQVKLLDLGLVSPLAGQSDLTGENMVMGTPDYVSPEQALDPRSADARSDIYSLGCTLYHLLAGAPPFSGNSTLGKLDDHRWREPNRPSMIPDSLWLVLSKMLAKQPELRYAAANEVADALAPFCALQVEIPKLDSCKPVISPLLLPPKSRFKNFTTVALALFALFALLGAFAVYRIQTDFGELVITTFDEEVQVVIEKNGKVIAILDKATNEKLELRSGTYDLRLKPENSALKLDLEQVTLKRGDKTIATIVRSKPTAESVPNQPGLEPTRPQTIDPWFAINDFTIRLNLNQDELSREVNNLGEGFRPCKITYVRGTTPPRFNLLAVREAEAKSFKVHYDLNVTGKDSEVDFKEMLAAKWALRDNCIYQNGDKIARHHLWIKDNLDFVTHGGPQELIESKMVELRRDGYWPIHLYLDGKDTGFGRADRPIGFLLARATTPQWEWFLDLDEASLNAKLAEAKKIGLRPIVLSEMGFGAEVNYALCLAANPKDLDWTYESHSNRAAFETAAKSLRSKKLRPLAILSSDIGGAQQFRSIWIPNEPSPNISTIATVEKAQTFLDDGVWIINMKFSADGKRLFLGRGNATAEVWDVDANKRIAVLPHPVKMNGDATVRAVQPFDNETKLLTNHRSGVKAWDGVTAKVLFEIPSVGFDNVLDSCMSDDETLIAACHGSGKVRVWNAKTRELLKTYDGNGKAAWNLAWLPDGHRLAMSQDALFQIVDLDNDKILVNKNSDAQYFDIAASKPTSQLAVIQRNGRVTIYDLGTLQQKSQFLSRRGVDWAHYRMRWLPDGRIVTGGESLIDISDPQSGRVLYTLTGVKGLLEGLAISPDGKLIASCTVTGQINFWNVPTIEGAK